jgi:hypothetical protein
MPMLGENYADSAAKNYAAQNNAYAGGLASAGQTAPASGLHPIAEGIRLATSRIDQMSAQLGELAIAVHGPRPEPVDHSGAKQHSSDSLNRRVADLLEALDRLQRSYDSIIR